MLTRIELTNFMSHTATVIEPAAGLTVLVGPNNCGKSAVVAALQLLCKNPEAKFAVRHGAKECTVQVQTDDGHTIVWRRKTAASYELNGERFDRLGRGGIPDKLHELLKLPVVGDEADADFDIHFGAQKSPIFLLNSSPGTAARFFASSSDAIRLVEMQRRHKERLAERQRQKRNLEDESKQLADELERLEPAVELDRRLKATAEDYADCLHAAELLQQSERDAKALVAQSQAVTIRQAEHDALHPLVRPPELADPQPLAALRRGLAVALGAADRATARSQALAVLPLPPPLFDVATLSRTCQTLAELAHDARRTEAVQAAMRPLPVPPALADVEVFERVIDQLAAADRERRETNSRCAALRQLETAPPVLANTDSLSAALSKLTDSISNVQREEQRLAAVHALAPPSAAADARPLRECVARLAEAERLVVVAQQLAREAEQQLAVAREELFTYASAAECPTCGSPLDAERLLARAGMGPGGHGHG